MKTIGAKRKLKWIFEIIGIFTTQFFLLYSKLRLNFFYFLLFQYVLQSTCVSNGHITVYYLFLHKFAIISLELNPFSYSLNYPLLP